MDRQSWAGVDRDLFEALRLLRRRLAEERHVQPYIIFSDATLRELARIRPSNPEKMRLVYGIGDAKLREFGSRTLEVIDQQCRERSLSMDVAASVPHSSPAGKPASRPSPAHKLALELFRKHATIDEVVNRTERSRSTVVDYLCEHVRNESPASLFPWMAQELYDRIAAAAQRVGLDRLKPIFIALGEQVPYDDIHLVVAHLTRHSRTSAP